MGKSEVGISLVRRFGSCKAQPKFNPAELGSITCDGEIVFGTPEMAMNFARNQAVQALKSQSPYEKAVIIKDNIVKGIFSGDRHGVGICGCKPLTRSITVHGHPEDMPISHADARKLIDSLGRTEEVIALNSKGEYSSLKNLVFDTFSDEALSTAQNIVAKRPSFFQKLRNKLYVSHTDTTEITGNYCTSSTQNINEIAKNRRNMYHDYMAYILNGELGVRYKAAISKRDYDLGGKIIDYAQSSPEGKRRIHEFWTQNAARYGLEYKTNYSYLKS